MYRITLAAAALASLLAPFTLPSPAQAPRGKKYALLVGVRSYDHQKLRDLKYTENDAEELARVLAAARYDEVVVLTTTRGEKAAKARPTAANIRAELARLTKKVTKHDILMIGLAGHGVQYQVKVDGKNKEESFFCPSDARPTDSQDIKELSRTMLPLGELFRELDESGAGARLLLVDACRNDPREVRNLDIDHLPRPARGTAVLFSCKGGETAHETGKLGKGHGVFFYHVIQALRGEAKNRRGAVTWDSLTAHVKGEVAEVVPTLIGGGAKQTPHLMANVEGDPVLVPPAQVQVRPKDRDKGGAVDDPKKGEAFLDEKLSGWEGLPGYWSYADGELTGKSPRRITFNTFLCSKKEYTDFELKFKVRLKGGVNNTGVQIRSWINKRETFTTSGPQADIGGRFWGSLYGENFGGMMRQAAPRVQKAVKERGFNDYSIKVVGKRVTIKVNGETAVDDEFPKLPARGIIAFQIHAGEPMEVTFKEVEFTDLSR